MRSAAILAQMAVLVQREHASRVHRIGVAGVLGLESPQSVDAQQGFFDLGMDSLTSIELRNQLQDALACSLPAAAISEIRSPTLLVWKNDMGRDTICRTYCVRISRST